MTDHEPKILVFLCNWCPAAAVDRPDVAAVAAEKGVREVRVFCSGMVDPSYVVKALASGADGVLIAACPPGNCHYMTGNVRAHARYHLLQKLLGELGVERERFRLEWVPHHESHKYLAAIDEMARGLAKLGPAKVGLGRG